MTQLKEIKPDIISVSIKMWGNDGPLGHQTGYAPCFAALAGLASLVGYPGGPPLGTSMRYGDSTVGAAAAYAAVVALLHRELSGDGQFVDVSAVETLSSMIGDCLLEQALTGQALRARRQRPPRHVPAWLLPLRGRRLDHAWPSPTTRMARVVRRARCRGAGRRRALRHHGRATPPRRGARRRPRATHPKPRCRATRASPARGGGPGRARAPLRIDVIGDQRLWDRELYRFVSDHREGQRPILGPSWRMARGPGADRTRRAGPGRAHRVRAARDPGRDHRREANMTRHWQTPRRWSPAPAAVSAPRRRKALAAEGAAVALLARRADRLDRTESRDRIRRRHSAGRGRRRHRRRAGVGGRAARRRRVGTARHRGEQRRADAVRARGRGVAAGLGRHGRGQRARRPVRHPRCAPAPDRRGRRLAARRRRSGHHQFHRRAGWPGPAPPSTR